MLGKQLQDELKVLRRRLKQLRNQYGKIENRDAYVEVEDRARRAYAQLGYAQDSLETLADELARVDKHMAALAKAERKINKNRSPQEEAELTVSHDLHRDFRSTEVFKLK